MDPVSCRRWSLAFVAFRWRHLMWVLPLLGLLAGVAIEWRKYERSLQRSGEIEVAGPSRLAGHPLFSGHFPTYDFATVQRLALSDEVLAAACDHAELTRDGKPLAQCITELRDKIELAPIPGTPSVLVSIRGRPTPQTGLMAEAVVRKMVWHAERLEYLERGNFLEKEKGALAELRKSINGYTAQDLDRALRDWQFSTGRVRPGRSAPGPPGSALLPGTTAEEEDYFRRKAGWFLAERFHQKDKGPLLVKRWPYTPIPAPTTGQRVQEATPTILTATGSGILVGVTLAYLLEALFPGKRKSLEAPAG